MSMKKFGVVLLSIFAVLVFVSSVNADEKEKCCTKNVPDSILKTFQAAYPNAVIKEGEAWTKGTTTYYEIESKEGSQEKKVVYNSDGSVFMTKESIDVNNLPGPIKDAIAKAYPKYEIKEVEKIVRDNAAKYKVCLKRGWFMYKKVFIDESGNPVKWNKKK